MYLTVDRICDLKRGITMGKTVVWSVTLGSGNFFMECVVQERALKPVGVSVSLVSEDSVWHGTVSEDAMKDMAKKAQLPLSEFVGTTIKALTGVTEKEFVFDFKKSDNRATLSWKKLVPSTKNSTAGLSFHLGSVELMKQTGAEAGEKLFGTLRFCVEKNKELAEKVEFLEQENSRFKLERTEALQELEKATEAKQEFESEIFSQFAHVLNNKKKRNEELVAEIEDLRSGRMETEESNSTSVAARAQSHVTTTAVSSVTSKDQRISSGEDTDEEKEKTEAVRKEKSFLKRATELSDAADKSEPTKDEDDDLFVPSRNRKRGRRQKQQPEEEEKGEGSAEVLSQTRRTRSSQRSSGGSSLGNSSSLIGQLS